MALTNETTSVPLTGEWVITAMTSQLQCLMGHRKQLLSAGDSGSRGAVTLDLGGVEALDASGCQLLAAFLKVLEKDGFQPDMAAMPASFHGLFESLGYCDRASDEES